MKKLLLLLLLVPSLCLAGQWEKVSGGWSQINMYRFSMPKGWLIWTSDSNGESLIFYSDEKHEWVLK